MRVTIPITYGEYRVLPAVGAHAALPVLISHVVELEAVDGRLVKLTLPRDLPEGVRELLLPAHLFSDQIRG
jgi:hypothetical protein